ncbi:glutamine amidotransferase [Janibacter alkaliphilus]|uniref:GMP synthase (Glutamine-hydrolyzing) n=1 Tax=Janibacter alkaliphilus TaxID=1069963 RepID=A0A852XAE0_9MICO|nr:GMP synthase (glutamine-hydrolyzing) [Janibacter alkaliphilus]
MKPFLLLATRADDVAADDEYAAFLRYSGLREDQLVRHRLEQHPLPRIDLDDWSGFIVGGSPFNVTDREKTAVQRRVEAELADLVARVVAADHPFLGACFGVGVLGSLPGGVVDRTFGEPPTSVRLTQTEAGRTDPLLAGVGEHFHAIVGHKEACRVLPEGATLLVAGEACLVQMFRIGRNVYATQFHPELDADSLAERLRIYAGHGYCEPEEADALVAQARAADVGDVREVLRTFVARHAR